MIPPDFIDVLFHSLWVIGVLAFAAAVGIHAMKNRNHRRRNR